MHVYYFKKNLNNIYVIRKLVKMSEINNEIVFHIIFIEVANKYMIISMKKHIKYSRRLLLCATESTTI